jgi:hypothetical protein
VFSIGDKAKLLDENSTVTVKTVFSPVFVEVENEHGFRFKVNVSQLIRLSEDDAYTMENLLERGALKTNSKKDRKPKTISSKPHVNRKKPEGEHYIDLHDHALPEQYHRMLQLTKFERAMTYFEDELWRAQKAKLHLLRVNHGIGEGILRTEIRKRLNDRGYSFHDESFDNPGTTVILLRDSL